MWARTIVWSPDGSMIAVVNAFDPAHQLTEVFWDARDGRLLHADPPEKEHLAVDAMFSPDSKELIIGHPDGVIEMLATDTWARSNEATLDKSIFDLNDIGFVGYSHDGSSIIAVTGLAGRGGSSIIWIDPTTLQATNSVPKSDLATPKSTALSPDGVTLAIGASDGSLRIWDTNKRQLIQQMQFGSRVQGLAFLDPTHLAVVPGTGDLLVMTIDPAELVSTVRASITRPFTQTECTTYGIDPCPTLAQIKAP